jgi:hypothetical protein
LSCHPFKVADSSTGLYLRPNIDLFQSSIQN